MEKVSSYGATQAHMTVTFTKIIFMAQASTYGPMVEFTKEIGLMENNMDKANIYYKIRL